MNPSLRRERYTGRRGAKDSSRKGGPGRKKNKDKVLEAEKGLVTEQKWSVCTSIVCRVRTRAIGGVRP